MHLRKTKIVLSLLTSFFLLFFNSDSIFADYAIQNNTAPKYQRDKFSTDLFTGTANYSYPIKVPKGTNDLTPEVSLNYNSAGVRDLRMYSGIGWLLNQDYIHRDINATPTNTNDDKFKLYFKGVAYDLVYVASDGYYHTKVETYLKIQKLTGGQNAKGEYWLVTTPDGTKYRFGYQSQSELECNGRDYITMWNIDLVTDADNNNVYYTYGEVYGISYLETIRYNNDQTRKIVFNYANGPVTRPIYLQGCYMFDPNKLENIEIFVNEDFKRGYNMTYTYANNNQPLLSTIVEKGSEGGNYLTTSFAYNDEIRNWITPHQIWLNNQQVEAPLDIPNVTMADVNGDGYTDVIRSDHDGNNVINVTWKIMWNTGSGFANSFQTVINNVGIDTRLTQKFTRVIDVTGDGLPDIVRAADGNAWRVFRNTGSSWNTTYEQWGDLSGGDGSIKLTEDDVTLADMTGDGLVDVVHTKAHNGGYQWEVHRNTGSSWSTTREVWHDGTNMPVGLNSPQARLIDVNGDGLSDIVRTVYDGPLSTWYVWLNTGSGFRSYTMWLDDFVNAHFQEPLSTVTDANGDGLIDIIRNENQDPGSADRWKVLVNRGDNWTNQWDNWIEYSANVDINVNDNKTKMTDVTGDGLPDIVRGYDNCNCNRYNYFVWKNAGVAPHLLKQVTTERGGVIQFEYKPSTQYDNTGVDSQSDLPFASWVVSKMTVTNGLSNAQGTNDITTYSYKDGYYKWQDKEFRGFKEVETTEPNGSKKKYVYHQDDGLKGKLVEVQTRDNQNNPYAEIEYSYNNTSSNGVYKADVTEEKHYTYDGSATNPKVKQVDYMYDVYGNVLIKSELGDTSVTGDERYTHNEYTANTTNWIVNTPRRIYLNASDDATKIHETKYYYDNNAGNETSPTKGNLTKEVKWTNGLFSADPTINYTYDTFGNQTEIEDANGHFTYIDYDTTGTYPTYKANAKDHEEYFGYDLGTGNLLYKTDPNGNTTNYQYDQFGRLLKEIKPGDDTQYPTISYTYYTSGVDGTKVSKKENVGSTSATLDTFTWIDGLGRTISTRTDAENSSKQIVTNTYYDSTGQVKKVTVPHEDDHYDYYRDPLPSIRNTDTTYDALGRPIVITNPKGGNKIIAYDHWKETTTDENNNIKREFKNAFDKIIKVEEVNDIATYTTTYTYDSRDLLTKITDHESNEITFAYDALGRKISMVDPDMGTWEYEYDAVGNHTKQTDNRNVEVVKEYDEINRLKKTNYPTDTDVVYTYDGNSKKGTLTSVTDAAGTVAYTYDNRLRKLSEARTVNGTTKTTQFAYDPIDRVTTQTNPDNEVITNAFNNQGEIESVSNVVSNVNYNALGKITQKTFNNGLSTNYTYNTTDFRLNRIQTSTLQDLNYTYDNVGNVASITDAVDSKTQTFTYDDLDRLKTASESAGYNYAYNYSPIGNLTKFTNAGVETEYGYGSNGKPHAMTSSTEKVAPPHVNGSGTPLTSSITDNWSSGTISSSKWNNWGGANVSIVSEQLKMQSTLSGNYFGIESDVDGKLYDLTWSSVTNELVNAGNQNIGTWEVYPLYIYEDGDTSTQYFFYISENRLKAYKKVNGTNTQLTDIAYNSTNHRWFRITEWDGTTYFDVSADGSTWNNIADTPNAFDVSRVVVGTQVGTWDTESSTTSAIFDNFNYAKAPTATITDDWTSGSINASKWLNWGGSQVGVTGGELTMTSETGGGYYGIDSDVSGKMYNMTNSSVVNKLVNAGNQSLGTWEVYPLYVYPEGDNSYQYFFYISENTLKAYKKVDGSTTQLASTAYNTANHKWFRIREASGTTYFDVSADGGTWNNFASTANEFEALAVGVGVMVGTWDTEASTTTAKFDNFNVWNPVYVYDANGNMTSDGLKCYTYNEANQLSKVKECGNNHTIAEYIYDYDGLRMVKKNFVTGTLASSVVSWSDGYETKTKVGGTAQNTTYYWVNGELLAKKDSSNNRFYYHNDHLGSSALLTAQNGSVTEETKYDPWGEVLSGGTKSKFQYTGQEMDAETGLNYYNFRYYNSDTRRFTQPDDIIQSLYAPQSLNRYSYVWNNPVRYTDPTGHYVETALDIAFLIMDMHAIKQDPTNPWNYAAFGGDIAGTITPGLTGVGLGVKTFKHVDDAEKIAKGYRKVNEFDLPANYGANNALNGLNLQKSLAHQEQVGNVLNKVDQGKVIAGPGSKTVFRDAPQAAAKYGGNAYDYVKKTTTAAPKTVSNGTQVQTHWVENIKTGIMTLFKPKITIPKRIKL
jgi:RHS repeat-associated protein